MHAAESLTNVLVGYLINLVLVYLILHWLGYGIRPAENAAMSLVLASVSFLRGWWIRKLFNRLANRRSVQ